MSRWIKTVRSIYGLTQEDLARYLGKTRGAVSMYEADLAPVPIESIATIRSTFQDAPPPPGFAGAIEPKAALVTEQTLPFIAYAGVVPATNWGDPLSSDERRPIEAKFAGEGRFLCKVVGDSCWPALWQGDLIVFERSDAPHEGLMVLAERMDDMACTVKELVRVDGRMTLQPVNPDYEEVFAPDGWKVSAVLVGVLSHVDGPEETWYDERGIRSAWLTRKRKILE